MRRPVALLWVTGVSHSLFSINYEDLQKTVTAFGYLTPDRGETYPDMPSPLNEIYERLKSTALTTKEVARENIS